MYLHSLYAYKEAKAATLANLQKKTHTEDADLCVAKKRVVWYQNRLELENKSGSERLYEDLWQELLAMG